MKQFCDDRGIDINIIRRNAGKYVPSPTRTAQVGTEPSVASPGPRADSPTAETSVRYNTASSPSRSTNMELDMDNPDKYLDVPYSMSYDDVPVTESTEQCTEPAVGTDEYLVIPEATEEDLARQLAEKDILEEELALADAGIFQDGIEVLGSPIGSTSYMHWFARQKVLKAMLLAHRACTRLKQYPHELAALLRCSVSSKLHYLARLIPLDVVHRLWLAYDLFVISVFLQSQGIDPSILLAKSVTDDTFHVGNIVMTNLDSAFDLLMEEEGDCPAFSWHFYMELLSCRFGGDGVAGLSRMSISLRLGAMVNVGAGNSHAANFLSQWYARTTSIPCIRCLEAAGMHDVSISGKIIDRQTPGFPNSTWIELAASAYHDAGGGMPDRTLLSDVPVLPFDHPYHDVSVLMHFFRVTISDNADDGQRLQFTIAPTEAHTPRTKPHPEGVLRPNRASRTLAHVLSLQMRSRLLVHAPTEHARKAFEASGHLGHRDVMGMLPTFNSCIEPAVYRHFQRLKFGLVEMVNTSRLDMCQICREPLMQVNRAGQQIIHSSHCSGQYYFIDMRHDSIRDLLVSQINKSDQLVAWPERHVGIEHKITEGVEQVGEVFSDVTAIGEFDSAHNVRIDLDVTVTSSQCSANLSSPVEVVLNAAYNRKMTRYKSVQFIDQVEHVTPFVMMDCGVLDSRANSWLYRFVNSTTPPWKRGHIVNALAVQSIRAKLARIAMRWTYYGHRATLLSDVKRVPRGRMDKHARGCDSVRNNGMRIAYPGR